MSVYGYGRVSTDDQTSDNQKQVVELQQKMHIDQWFEEHAVSGKTKAEDRPMFSKMCNLAVAGDTIVFTRVDRVGRKASNVLTVIEKLIERGVEVYILQIGAIGLSTQVGKMMLGMFAIFAEMERDSIVERTKDGLARTKRAGTKLGAPLKITPKQLGEMLDHYRKGAKIGAIAEKFGFPRNTVERNIEKWGHNLFGYEKEFNVRQAQYSKASKAQPAP